MADEWFRSPDWSEEARADFEGRLSRARPHNRPQYMRIKGLALGGAGHLDSARALWARILESDDAYSFEVASTLEHLGDSYLRDDPARAETYYRQLLTQHSDLNGTTACAHLSLAEILITRRDKASIAEAGDLLNIWITDFPSPFPSALFRFHLDLIEVAQALGDKETVKRAARTALGLADRGPVFSRHKDVGLVIADAKVLKRLHKLAK